MRRKVHGERGVVNCPKQAAGKQKKDSVNGTVNIEQLSSTLVSKIVLPKQSTEVSATGFVEESSRGAPQVQIRSTGCILSITIAVDNWCETKILSR